MKNKPGDMKFVAVILVFIGRKHQKWGRGTVPGRIPTWLSSGLRSEVTAVPRSESREVAAAIDVMLQ